MLLRFAKEMAPETPSGGGECVHCGFVSSTGMRRDADGALRCAICHAANHAADADGTSYRLTWAPEIDQRDLAHLARVLALLAIRNRSAVPPRAEHLNLVSAFTQLEARATALDDRVRAAVGQPMPAAWTLLDEATRAEILLGLRVFPTRIAWRDVEAWVNDESTLNGYGDKLLDEQRWFAGRGHEMVEAAPFGELPETRRPSAVKEQAR